MAFIRNIISEWLRFDAARGQSDFIFKSPKYFIAYLEMPLFYNRDQQH